MEKEKETKSKKFTKAEWTDLYELAIIAQEKLLGGLALAAEVRMLEELRPSKIAKHNTELVELVGALLEATSATDQLVERMLCAGMVEWECPIDWKGGMTATEILEWTREEQDRQAYLTDQAQSAHRLYLWPCAARRRDFCPIGHLGIARKKRCHRASKDCRSRKKRCRSALARCRGRPR